MHLLVQRTPKGKVPSEETKGNWKLANHQFIHTSKDIYNLRPIFINDSSREPPATVLERLTASMKKFAKDAATVGVNFDTSGRPILINEFSAPVRRRVESDNGRGRGRGRGAPRGRGRGRGSFGGGRPSFVYEITPGEQQLVQLLENIPEKVYILLVLNRGNDSAIYNRLKEIVDRRFGVLNSCVVWEFFSKNSAQYNTNAVMKMNLKLQGTNHSLRDKDSEL